MGSSFIHLSAAGGIGNDVTVLGNSIKIVPSCVEKIGFPVFFNRFELWISRLFSLGFPGKKIHTGKKTHC